MHIFSNAIGVFVFDEEIELVDKILFSGLDDYKNKEKFIAGITGKYKNQKELDRDTLKKVLLYFKNNKFFNDFYSKNVEITKSDVKDSVRDDILIIHAINSVEEIDKSVNILVKRLREWYELYNPEFSMAVESHERFVEEILEKEKKDLLKELKIEPSYSIGADLKQEDIEPIKSLAHQVYDLFQLKKSLMNYISTLMDELCPNIKAVCGVITGAMLIDKTGSLKRLSELPASTVQVLGAENALFRHMKTGAKPPRHGVIIHHPLLANAPNKVHGKIARVLADKIAIASKVDYFKGQFIGDKLRKILDDKFGQQNDR